MCSGLGKFPDEVLSSMSLPQAQSLMKFWQKHPAILYGAGAVGPTADGGNASMQAGPPRYTTKEEVAELVRMYGPRN